jgi:3-hydroxy-9,10-secoandrosta-1,3,5(10)-triene-9,17-dione monooxygenase
VRARLATSSGGDEVSDAAAAQVAWAASDIDAARVQVTSPLEAADDLAAATWVHRQAVARARDAADRLLANSRHALDASDPVTLGWQDVQAGCRLAAHLVELR